MNDPRYKFGIAALFIIAAIIGGKLAVFTPDLVKLLVTGVAAWAVGYGQNGFGKVYAGFDRVSESVSTAVAEAMQPFAERLCAVEDALGIEQEAAPDNG